MNFDWSLFRRVSYYLLCLDSTLSHHVNYQSSSHDSAQSRHACCCLLRRDSVSFRQLNYYYLISLDLATRRVRCYLMSLGWAMRHEKCCSTSLG